MISEIRHITIVGSGNVASYFGRLLHKHAYTISAVISRNIHTGRMLADKLGTKFSSTYEIDSKTDLLILCVNDDEVGHVNSSLITGDYAVCHCAGSLSVNILKSHASYGVIYPLQSIHKDTDIVLTEVPFLIETNGHELQKRLENFLNNCHKSFYVVDSEKRLAYHLAAVFANNFTNAMLMAAEGISENFKLDFNLLKPLMAETFNRIEKLSPAQVQTGPAKRNDRATIERHLALLSGHPEMKKLYESVSGFIGEKFRAG